MSTSPLLPCKDPPLLQRLSIRASSSQQHSMDEDARPLGQHGGDRRGMGPVVPARIVGRAPGGLAPVHQLSGTPPVPVRPDRRNTQPPSPQEREVITLDRRRNGPPQQNEYVDNPAITIRPGTINTDRELVSLLTPGRPTTGSLTQAIISQPQPTDLKDHSTNKGQHIRLALDTTPSSLTDEEPHESIYCKKCGKCKCKACTSPRELPTKWVCNKRYKCSAEAVIECCSCLCCVKSVFYHCENSEDNVSTMDMPCACCERPHCCKRWTCMGLTSVCVPCLCLYWPLRALVGLTTACYNRCSRRGCQCHREKSTGQTLTKRPLIDSESSSA